MDPSDLSGSDGYLPSLREILSLPDPQLCVCFVKKQTDMEDFFRSVCIAIREMLSDAYACMSGIVVSTVGYFLPVKNYLLLLLFFFIADIVFGYWAAHRLRQEKFSTKIIWEKTVPRMVLAVFLVLGTFMWDKVFGQEMVPTCAVVGWFFCGVLLASIAKNGWLITKWDVFPMVSNLIGRRMGQQTGVDIRENDHGRRGNFSPDYSPDLYEPFNDSPDGRYK